MPARRLIRGLLSLLDEIMRLPVERPCERLDDVECRRLLTAFDLTDVIPGEVSLLGEALLGESGLQPE